MFDDNNHVNTGNEHVLINNYHSGNGDDIYVMMFF